MKIGKVQGMCISRNSFFLSQFSFNVNRVRISRPKSSSIRRRVNFNDRLENAPGFSVVLSKFEEKRAVCVCERRTEIDAVALLADAQTEREVGRVESKGQLGRKTHRPETYGVAAGRATRCDATLLFADCASPADRVRCKRSVARTLGSLYTFSVWAFGSPVYT